MKASVQATAPPRTASSPAARHAAAHGAAPSEAAAPHPGGRRIQVRRSGVHGKGVFALRPIAAGETVIEYVGELITWEEAVRRHPHDPEQPDHTFYFHLDEVHVIDGGVGGNASRWINHSCAPNLEADDSGGRVLLRALHDIQPGEELFFDYGLVIDERYTPALKKRFECRCGAPDCRRTMLAPKRGGGAAKGAARQG
jgi:SET domain-containing protein